ncbi:LuxR family transcriptional regulator [Isoptericola chiayiensis]|uniref:LuxR family transcriptional regulator n=1 Tax=Isoptericola chiayiensis TaxID=579446 RepID=A0ABP8YHV0_9MICO|nr:LuxR C-terminal-related transcriptional regulator [Isoptericola chiayiensis]NOW00546.1 DNA-binding CsgD family transcriptional regulator [Isoptericola chiayiensis]
MGSTGGLLGRADELRQVAALIGAARNRHGGALAVLGDPGVGKTSLLSAACTDTDARVVHVDGFESESAMPFAAVERLTGVLREFVDGVPARQREALQVATGRSDGPPPDRFLVGLAVLSTLAAAGTGRPLVCAVDDAHLVDRESLAVLAFVGRRLQAERVALILAGRDEPALTEHLTGVALLRLVGLAPEPAAALLNRATSRPFTATATTAVVRATGGNPLALVDLATDPVLRELPTLGLGPDPVTIGRHLEAHYLRRVMVLAGAVQRWLLLAAADPTGDPTLLAGAADRLGLPPDAGDDAETAGLVRLVPQVRFRHPLVRSAIYTSASGRQRRAVHRALAGAADQLGLVEAEAWHASRAVRDTDEDVATRLDRAAELAARRGGTSSRASILARAADVSSPGPQRGQRLVAAAEAALAAGAADVADRLLADVPHTDLDPVTRGRRIEVRAGVALFVADPSGVRRTTADHLRAAEQFRGRDRAREQDALLRAFETCLTTEHLAEDVALDELGRRIADGADSDVSVDVVLRGISAVALAPAEEAVAPVRQAHTALLALPDAQMLHRAGLLTALAMFLWDDAACRAALDRAVRAARRSGALQALDSLLWTGALAELAAGSVRRAVAHDQALREVRRAMGYDGANVVNAALLAWTGAPEKTVLALADGADATGFGGVGSSARAALAVRLLSERRYQEALDLLDPLMEKAFLHTAPLHLADHAEAAARSGDVAAARRDAAALRRRAHATGSSWCAGLARRATALAGEGDSEAEFRASLEALSGTVAEVEQGRSHLVYGEWLRRRRRRREAAVHLRRALELFTAAGAEIFLPRARAELDAVGGAPPGPEQDGLDLTTQERVIARAAAAGRTNAEIAANLFLSPNTVDYHLRKIFQKLGVTSRRQLADRLGG